MENWGATRAEVFNKANYGWNNLGTGLQTKTVYCRCVITEALSMEVEASRGAISILCDKGSRTHGQSESRTSGSFDMRGEVGDEVSWTTRISQHIKCGQGRQAIQVYAEMQEAGVKPSSYTFVAALKACTSIQDLESGKKIHSHVVHSGLESHLFVANMLVNLYAKCGSLIDARSVFENMPHRDVVSWNAMIFGYAEMAEGDVALHLYARMQQECIIPNARTFVGALKACSTVAALKWGSKENGKPMRRQLLRQASTIHSEIVKTGFESDLFVGTMLVDVYAKCGSLADARLVFEKLPHRNVVAWTAMILGYAQMDEGEVALQLYARMQNEGLVPNSRTMVGALKACSSLVDCDKGHAMTVRKRCLEQAMAIHFDIVDRVIELDLYLGSMLVEVYSKCGSLVDARQVFETMPHHDIVSWTAMILGYAQMEEGELALQFYARMQHDGVVPDAGAFVGALKACSNLAGLGKETKGVKERCLKQTRSIHADVIHGGFELDVFVGNMLVDAYAKCGSLVDAMWVFERMPHRDIVSWTAMMSGFAQMEEGELALRCYTRMRQEGVTPDARAYVAALKACGSLIAAEGYRGDGEGVQEQCLQQIRAIHSDIAKEGGFVSNELVGNTLIDAYAKCGSLGDARAVFEKLPHRDVVSWTTMILSYAEMEAGDVALHLYARMQQEGVVPNGLTYVVALKACGVVAALEKGKEIHAQIAKGTQLEATDSFVASSLIDMYGKCGSMKDAQQVFDAVPRQDIVSWNALIAGYARQGESEVIFNLIQQMKRAGIQADGVTLLSVLTACSHAGLVDKGGHYLECMSREFGITRTLEHYTCMVDLLGRAGQLDKAMALVRTMPAQPNGVLWRTVLGACQKWSNVELGRHAFDCAVRLDRHDVAAHVLMLNIYEAAHMQEHSKAIKAMRLKTGAWKQPGQTWWPDMSGVVHPFLVGDREGHEKMQTYAKLNDLSVKMMEIG